MADPNERSTEGVPRCDAISCRAPVKLCLLCAKREPPVAEQVLRVHDMQHEDPYETRSA